ncbi:hypothetical protein [Shouchella patagoniensis]|uniref:hypothetical protein n=1 Tax=Shouchella patagoniensis TaxID=228576 RepID=UPI001FEA9E99|nr:hypothetical protein [Shouchella patagoniensis]
MARISAWGIPIYTLETPVVEWNEEDGSITVKERTRAMGAKQSKTKKWTLINVLDVWRDTQALIKQVVQLKKKVDCFLFLFCGKRGELRERFAWKDTASSTVKLTGGRK